MERVVASAWPGGDRRPHRVADVAHFGAHDDPVVAEAGLLGQLRRAEGALGIASIMTSRASRGRRGGRSPPMSRGQQVGVQRAQFTPIRTGRSLSTATRTIVAKFSSRRFVPTFPGLIQRYLASAIAASGWSNEEPVPVVVDSPR